VAPSNADDPAGAGLNLSHLRILIVEDSWQLGTALSSLLRSLGADVAGPAASAAEAERLMSERVPDVAIVDINLRDGELAYDLIDTLNDRGVRVIVTSGYADVSFAAGKTAAVLLKPIREAQLLDSLRPLAASKPAR
jgi:CheY-like chemotaxis protein